MVLNKHIGSRSSAVSVLKKFYSQTQEDDISFEAIMSAVGRNDKGLMTNKAWLSNTLIALKYYDFVRVSYTSEFPKRMRSVVLRPEGKKALGRHDDSAREMDLVEPNRIVTPETIWRDIQILRLQNPSFQIDFYMHPKDETNSK